MDARAVGMMVVCLVNELVGQKVVWRAVMWAAMKVVLMVCEWAARKACGWALKMVV